MKMVQIDFGLMIQQDNSCALIFFKQNSLPHFQDSCSQYYINQVLALRWGTGNSWTLEIPNLCTKVFLGMLYPRPSIHLPLHFPNLSMYAYCIMARRLLASGIPPNTEQYEMVSFCNNPPSASDTCSIGWNPVLGTESQESSPVFQCCPPQ